MKLRSTCFRVMKKKMRLGLVNASAAKWIGQHFTVQMARPKASFRQRSEIFCNGQVSHQILTWSCAFNLLKTKLNAKRPTSRQQGKTAAAQGWQCMAEEETQCLVMSTGSRLQAVAVCKDSQQNLKKQHFIHGNVYYISALEMKRLPVPKCLIGCFCSTL